MRFSARRVLTLASAALLVGALGACSDDTTEPVVVGVPTGVAATATSATLVRVTWSQVTGATAYEVDRAEGAGVFASAATALTGTFFDDNTAKPGTAYRYVVRAVQGANKSANSAEAPVSTPGAAPKVAIVTGIPTSRTFFSDTTYVLSGYVKVTNGATLTIQAGTKIVGDTLVAGSSLWILRGAKIQAVGTAAAPIVFTSQRTPGNRLPGDWGGILVIGNGLINRTANPIFTEGPQGDAAVNYAGGNNNADNSGSIKYVRVEFAGYDVSNGGGQELNTISSYAVGSGTQYDYVESMAGLDDSFEFWGGAVDIGHMVSFESGDDHFDWTEGYQGRGQFLIALQTSVIAPKLGTGTVSTDPRGFEGDGCDNAVAGCTFANPPYSEPLWANFTIIGPGTGVFTPTDGNGAVLRRGTGGYLVNGIIGRWPGVGVSIRDTETGGLMALDSLMIRGLILSDNVANFEAAAAGRFGDQLQTNATAWKITTPALAAVFPGALPTKTTDPVTTANLNLQPATGSPAATAGLNSFAGTRIANRTANYLGASVTATAYVGAIDPAAATRWYEGWTSWLRK